MKPTFLAGPLSLAALLVIVIAAEASQSQVANAGKWWQDEHTKRELGLTADQSRQLEEIFQAAVPKQKNLKNALDAAEALLEQYVLKRDKKAAEDQVTRVANARAELNKSHALMLLEMWWVLSPQQYTKLGELQKSLKPRAPEKGK